MQQETATQPAPVKIIAKESGHWYHPDGRPCYEIEKADKSGMRPTTLRDGKKLGLLPSVTTILKILHKEALVRWKVEQAVLVAMTTPRLPGEADDAFIERIFNVEEQHDAEAKKARDLGTDIHGAIELALQGKSYDENLRVYVEPVLRAITKYGVLHATEKTLVGNGYAGKTDAIFVREPEDDFTVIDFKSAKKLPEKSSCDEHVLQAGAYANAFFMTLPTERRLKSKIRTVNIYISTTKPGEFTMFENGADGECLTVYERGFKPLVAYWQFMTKYIPPQNQIAVQ